MPLKCNVFVWELRKAVSEKTLSLNCNQNFRFRQKFIAQKITHYKLLVALWADQSIPFDDEESKEKS